MEQQNGKEGGGGGVLPMIKTPHASAFDVLSRLVPDAVHACDNPAAICAFIADAVFRAHGLKDCPDEPAAVFSSSSSFSTAVAAAAAALHPRYYSYTPKDAYAQRVERDFAATEPAVMDGQTSEHVSLHCATLFDDPIPHLQSTGLQQYRKQNPHQQLILHARRGSRGTIHRLAIALCRFFLDSELGEIPPNGDVVYRLARWDCRLDALVARIEAHSLFIAVPGLRPPALVADLVDFAIAKPFLLQSSLSFLAPTDLGAVAATTANAGGRFATEDNSGAVRHYCLFRSAAARNFSRRPRKERAAYLALRAPPPTTRGGAFHYDDDYRRWREQYDQEHRGFMALPPPFGVPPMPLPSPFDPLGEGHGSPLPRRGGTGFLLPRPTGFPGIPPFLGEGHHRGNDGAADPFGPFRPCSELPPYGSHTHYRYGTGGVVFHQRSSESSPSAPFLYDPSYL